MKRFLLLFILALSLGCWQCAATERTEVNPVTSDLPGVTVDQQQDAAATISEYTGTVEAVGTGELYAENKAATTTEPDTAADPVDPVPPNENTDGDSPVKEKGFWELIGGYWAELLLGIMAVIKILVRITPSIKDDAVFGWLDKLIEMIVPNLTTRKNG
jgi:hypothetical protein